MISTGLYVDVRAPGPRKSLVSCGIALIIELSLRPMYPLLGESPIAVAAHGTTAGDP
jgi:hypothetical protein